MGYSTKNQKNSVPAEEFVSSLYHIILGRAADQEGLSNHVDFIRRGGDPSIVYKAFIDSDEFKINKKRAKSHHNDEIVPFEDVNKSGFGLDMVINASINHFSDRAFLNSLQHVTSLIGRKKRKVRTIAIYYHKLRSGGIERVTAWQVTEWKRLGYNVILLADEAAHADDYPYDISVKRFVIPEKMMWSDHGEYVNRGRALADILQTINADVFVTNLGHEICTVWDILVAKSLGIPVILGWHNVFDADYHDGQSLDAAQIRLLGHRYADLTTVLTTMDQLWFTLNGYASRVVPNPPTFTELPKSPSSLDGKTLVWVARVERHQKRVDHAIQMMPLVLTEHPEAKLLIVGGGPEIDWARNLASSLGVASRVHFVGYTDNVGAYLEQAAIHVMTSEFEGFGLALEEAWSYGLPTVMYDLPYLELVKHSNGYISVPQMDVRALAEAVSKLLSDRDRLKKLGEASRIASVNFRKQPVSELWRNIFDDVAIEDRMGPSVEDFDINPDMRQIVQHLSDKLFPPSRPTLGLPIPKEPTTKNLQRVKKLKHKVTGLAKFLPMIRFKPLRMIDCTSIPLGDSFMFFSGLYAMLANGLEVCATDCVLHTHKPLVGICEILFAEFGLKIIDGPPRTVIHPFFYSHPPVSNDDMWRTYLGSDWRMDWVEAIDRQKTIGRPDYKDNLRKLLQMFISDRLIYRRRGGWKTATPSYIGFRVWWPIALKMGVYPVVFYSMMSRSLDEMRQKLRAHIDELILIDSKIGKKPFEGNAAFPTGNSYQTIDPATYATIMESIGDVKYTCFVQNDNPWYEDFTKSDISVKHINSIEETFKIIRSADKVFTCCSFTSHVAQFLRDDFVLAMFKDFPENNVHPGANPKILTYTPACSPCNYLPRGKFKTCPAGYDHCLALENPMYRQKIINELRN